jgi:ATP adenylyltransferase
MEEDADVQAGLSPMPAPHYNGREGEAAWKRTQERGVSMEQLWAPWRLAYVANPKAAAAQDPCFICRCLAESNDRANLLAWRGPRSVVFLNRFPYSNGHLLVAPRAHKGELRELDDGETLEIQQTLERMIGALGAMMKPDGYNLGVNLGRVAGAGLPGHLHWHIVPRWQGDTNFMTVLEDVRVIVQSLDSLYQLLTEHLGQGPQVAGKPAG